MEDDEMRKGLNPCDLYIRGVPVKELDPKGCRVLKSRLLEEAREIIKQADMEGRDKLSSKEREKFDSLISDVKRLEIIEKRPSVSMIPMPIGVDEGFGDEARFLKPDQEVRSMMGYGDEGLSLGRYLKGIVTGDWRGALPEHRALEIGDSTLGGYLLPTPLSTKIIDLARKRSVCIEAGALTVPMETKDLRFATIEKDPTAYWRGEGEPITESDMNFGLRRLDALTLAALVRCSIELFEDADNLDQIVSASLSQALALELDRACLFGKQSNGEPLGLYETQGVNRVYPTEGGGPLSGYRPFVEAVGKILEANGPGPGALALIMNPREWTQMATWTDDMGQPLRPPTVYEEIRKKLVSNQIPKDMGQGNNASCAFVGDFSWLWVGMRTNLTVEVSRDADTAFKNLQVLIRAYLRADVCIARPALFTVVDGIVPAGD